MNNRAIAACDAAVDIGFMAGAWVITNKRNDKINKGQVTATHWLNNSVPSAEAIILLNLVYYVYKVAKQIRRGSIEIYHDNLKVILDVTRTKYKTTEFAQDSSVAIEEIKALISKLSIRVNLIHIKKKKKDYKSTF